MTSIPNFSERQEKRLRCVGLKDEQIAALGKTLLGIRTILMLMGRQAPLSDVRDELDNLHGSLVAGRKAVERMQSPSRTTALREAKVRIEIAEYDLAGSPRPLGRACDAMADAIALVEAVIAELPNGPRRHRTADPRPVRMIDNALAQGWAAAYRDTVMPPMPCEHLPSASAASVFREVVGICYEAVGSENTDPERAIKSYLAVRKKKRESYRSAHVSETQRRKEK